MCLCVQGEWWNLSSSQAVNQHSLLILDFLMETLHRRWKIMKLQIRPLDLSPSPLFFELGFHPLLTLPASHYERGLERGQTKQKGKPWGRIQSVRLAILGHLALSLRSFLSPAGKHVDTLPCCLVRMPCIAFCFCSFHWFAQESCIDK